MSDPSGSLGTREEYVKKRAIVHVSDKSGNALGIIPNVVDVVFTSVINGGSGNLKIVLPDSVVDVENDEKYAAKNKVEITIVDRDDPGGVTLYSGEVYSVTGRVVGGREIVELVVTGFTSELEKTPYIDGNDASITHNSQDPADVFEDIFDKLQEFRNSPAIDYDTGTVDSANTNISLTFNHKSCLGALSELMRFAPADYYWRVDADNTAYFKQMSSTPDHYFVYGRDIVDTFGFVKEYGGIRSGVMFWNNEAQSADEICRITMRGSAVDDYDKDIEITSDGRVTHWETFARKSERYLDGATKEVSGVEFILFDNSAGFGVDLENVKPGETFQITGLDSSIDFGDDPLVITATEYHLGYMKIKAENRSQIVTQILMDMNRRLEKQEYGEDSYRVGVGTYEVGRVTTDETWEELPLMRKYSSPIPIASSNTYNASDEGNVQVDLSGEEDDWTIKTRFLENPNNDGDHADENIGYLVLEEGVGYFPGGQYYECGKVEDNDGTFETVNFANTFSGTPFVFCCYYSPAGSFFHVRLQSRSTSSFQVKLQRASGDSSAYDATIYWFAMHNTGGDITYLPIDYEAPSTVRGVGDSWTAVNWDVTFASVPICIHQIQTYADSTPCSSRMKDLTASDCDVVCEEDAGGSHAQETLAILGFVRDSSDGDTIA